MNLDAKWVPMMWPCGPLAWAPRTKAPSVGAEVEETLEAWAKPASLDLLKGTPINCLVLDWADGLSEVNAQQHALQPLIAAARNRGISLVGGISGAEGAERAMESASKSGPSAVMMAKPQIPSPLAVLGQYRRDQIVWGSATGIFCATENEWPGLKVDNMKGDTAAAGPTGVPWVNSNAWFSLLARDMATGKTVWLDLDPPVEATSAHPPDYALAVDDK